MSLAASTALSFDGEDVAMEDRAMAGRFDFGQFRGQKESRGGVVEGGNGDLVVSIRDAVSVCGVINRFRTLAYCFSSPSWGISTFRNLTWYILSQNQNQLQKMPMMR